MNDRILDWSYCYSYTYIDIFMHFFNASYVSEKVSSHVFELSSVFCRLVCFMLVSEKDIFFLKGRANWLLIVKKTCLSFQDRYFFLYNGVCNGRINFLYTYCFLHRGTVCCKYSFYNNFLASNKCLNK